MHLKINNWIKIRIKFGIRIEIIEYVVILSELKCAQAPDYTTMSLVGHKLHEYLIYFAFEILYVVLDLSSSFTCAFHDLCKKIN